MDFAEWWNSYAHAPWTREKIVAQDAWNAAIAKARETALAVGKDASEAAKAKDAYTYIDGYQDAAVDVDDALRDMLTETHR